MKKSNFLYFLLVFAIGCNFLLADDSKFKVGVGGGLNLNLHSPEFNLSKPLTLSETNFNTNTNSLTGFGGLLINYRFAKNYEFSARLGYNSASADLKSETGATLETSLNYFSISPNVQFYNVLPLENLYLLGGLDVGLSLNSSAQISSSSITPQFGNSVNPRFALNLGIGYDYTISPKFSVSPELIFQMPLNQVSNSENYNSWSVPQIKFGVNISYSFSDESNKSVPTEDNSINLEIKNVRSFDKDGNPYEVSRVKVEELSYVEMFPLVPYIFFEESSSKPAKSLVNIYEDNQVGKFTVDLLEPNSFQINKSIMDIVGSRMQKYPNTQISLIGTNDNNKEKNNALIAKERVDFVQSYIVKNYLIDTNRIKTSFQGLPNKASALKDPLGIEENRRVEVYSDNKEILEPIMVEKERIALSEPNYIEFVTNVNSADTNLTWEMEITQTDRELKRISGVGNPDIIKWNVFPNEIMGGEIPLYYTLKVRNSKGAEQKRTGTLKTEFISFSKKKAEELPDKVISKFSLIVFDFDSPNISEADKTILDKYVIPTIKFNSTIQIFGYSDKIGDEKYNQKLALQRAENVKKYIEEKTKASKISVVGLGEKVQLFDNTSPIGRQLSRTVQVEILTPKN